MDADLTPGLPGSKAHIVRDGTSYSLEPPGKCPVDGAREVSL